MGYFIQQPEYKCQITNAGTDDLAEICTAKNICANDPRITEWAIDMDSDKSYINWQQKLDLMCAPPWKVGLLGTVYFIGWASTLLWLPRFGDKFGR